MEMFTVVAAGSAELVLRWEPLVVMADLNIGRLVAILPFQFLQQKQLISLENQQEVELDNQQGHGDAPSGCGRLG